MLKHPIPWWHWAVFHTHAVALCLLLGANYPTPGKATDIHLHCSVFLGLIRLTHLLGNQRGSHNVITALFCFHHISMLLRSSATVRGRLKDCKRLKKMPIYNFLLLEPILENREEGTYDNLSLLPREPPGNAEWCNFCANGICPAGGNYVSGLRDFLLGTSSNCQQRRNGSKILCSGRRFPKVPTLSRTSEIFNTYAGNCLNSN